MVYIFILGSNISLISNIAIIPAKTSSPQIIAGAQQHVKNKQIQKKENQVSLVPSSGV